MLYSTSRIIWAGGVIGNIPGLSPGSWRFKSAPVEHVVRERRVPPRP